MTYSNSNNIDLVVALLKSNNISDLVISPGGTNIPIVKMVQSDDFFIATQLWMKEVLHMLQSAYIFKRESLLRLFVPVPRRHEIMFQA